MSSLSLSLTPTHIHTQTNFSNCVSLGVLQQVQYLTVWNCGDKFCLSNFDQLSNQHSRRHFVPELVNYLKFKVTNWVKFSGSCYVHSFPINVCQASKQVEKDFNLYKATKTYFKTYLRQKSHLKDVAALKHFMYKNS